VQRPADRRVRPQRWRDAVTELLTLQTVCAAWPEALPNTLQGTATADDLDLDTLSVNEPPRGYGRDTEIRCGRSHGCFIVLGTGEGLKAALRAPATPASTLDAAALAQRPADMPCGARRVRRDAGCHLYFARPVTFLSCADKARSNAAHIDTPLGLHGDDIGLGIFGRFAFPFESAFECSDGE
jgi:hypothetical protein